jgi:GT2 family glycosyltransferase
MSSAPVANRIFLSVVVPTHGRTALFLETLSSLEQQTLASFELIVTDDSTVEDDRTLIREAVTAYAERTGRSARYIFSTPRLGQARNTNQGLAEAQGRLLRVLHSDDVLAPAALESEVALMDDPRLNLELLYHERVRFTTTPRFDPQQQPALTLIQPDLLFRSMMNVGTPLPSATVFRRELLDAIGGMREDFDFMCDWDLWIRMIACEHGRNRLIGRLSPGYVGWRAHPDSTTGRLWHRHFLEHEQLMEGIKGDDALSVGLIGSARTRDGFFAGAVRYRYQRLWDDVSRMTAGQCVRALPMILRCALSGPSRRARLTPARGAGWAADGIRRSGGLPKPIPVRPGPSSRRHVQRRRRSRHLPIRAAAFDSPSRTPGNGHHPMGQGGVRPRERRHSREAVGAPMIGPKVVDLVAMCSRVEIDFRFEAMNPNPGAVRVVTDYNNTTNFWSIRRLISGARALAIQDVNANAFVEPVLHQCLKFTSTESTIEVCLRDNQNLTSFGFKSLLERLFPRQFAWVDQSTRGPAKVLRYRRRAAAHASVWAPHSGWTFGMLTTECVSTTSSGSSSRSRRTARVPTRFSIVSPIALPELERYRGVRVLRFDQHDDLGWITRKKNLIAQEAAYSDILVCHDRFLLSEGFSQSFADWGYSYGIAAVRVRLEDGRRGLDWGVVSSQNHVYSSGGLLDYRAYSQYVYVPGGATLIRKSFWKSFPWNDNLFWNEHEDVELCRRVQRAGGIVTLSSATVTAIEDRWVHLNPVIPLLRSARGAVRPAGRRAADSLPCEGAGRVTSSTPWLVRPEPAIARSGRLYFLHIPKTAGITFGRFLQNHYTFADTLLVDEWKARELPRHEVCRHSLFSGHYSSEVLDAMGERPRHRDADPRSADALRLVVGALPPGLASEVQRYVRRPDRSRGPRWAERLRLSTGPLAGAWAQDGGRRYERSDRRGSAGAARRSRSRRHHLRSRAVDAARELPHGVAAAAARLACQPAAGPAERNSREPAVGCRGAGNSAAVVRRHRAL